MKKKIIGFLVCTLLITTLLPTMSGSVRELSNETDADDIKISNSKRLDDFSSTSLFFTENQGQFPTEVLFQTHIPEATVYLCKDKLVTVFTRSQEENQNNKENLKLKSINRIKPRESQKLDVISIVAEFIGVNPDTVIIGKHQLPHKNNYFIGNEPEQWYADVPNYQSVIYQDIYPGIDLKYYNTGGLLKYDFIVNPGANPSQIVIQYQGPKSMQMTSEGDLMITTRLGSIHEKKPIIYQDIDGEQQLVAGSYLLNDDVFSFIIEETYYPEYPLIIDPGLDYSTYLGGSFYDHGTRIAVDSSGCAYVTGWTVSNDFPTENPYDGTYNGVGTYCDAFITKLSPEGNTLEYSTYLGGTHIDSGRDIAIDSSGCAYITGWTYSSDFPTVNAFDDTFASAPYDTSDVFVSKLSPAGNELVYSTFLGGNVTDWEADDQSTGIAVDSNGCAYVGGYTYCFDFPIENPFDDTYNGFSDVFVTKFSPEGNSLLYSTYLGGYITEECYSIAIDNTGSAYITGITYSEDFPMENPYDDTPPFDADVFVTKFSPTGNTLEYSTYLGGTGEDEGYGITVDSSNCAYVTGFTCANDFPVENAYDDTYNGGYCDAFVTKFSSQGNTLEYSTLFGGIGWDAGNTIAVDTSGCAYITGNTDSSNYPVVNSYDGTHNGDMDAILTKFSPEGNALEYSTLFGGDEYEWGFGIAVDSNNCAYIMGRTASTNLPVENPFDDTLSGPKDAFVTKFPEDGGSNAPLTPQKPTGQTNGKAGKEYTYTSVTTEPQGDNIYYLFDWGDGNDSSWVGPYNSGEEGSASHTWASKGSYNIRVKAKNVNGDVSGWSEPLSVSMPRNRAIYSPLFMIFLERFPLLERFLTLLIN